MSGHGDVLGALVVLTSKGCSKQILGFSQWLQVNWAQLTQLSQPTQLKQLISFTSQNDPHTPDALVIKWFLKGLCLIIQLGERLLEMDQRISVCWEQSFSFHLRDTFYIIFLCFGWLSCPRAVWEFSENFKRPFNSPSLPLVSGASTGIHIFILRFCFFSWDWNCLRKLWIR